MSSLLTSVYYCSGDCSHCNKTLRRNKGFKVGKEEEKLTITENHEELTKISTRTNMWTQQCCRISEYKESIQKSIVFLYIGNGKFENTIYDRLKRQYLDIFKKVVFIEVG